MLKTIKPSLQEYGLPEYTDINILKSLIEDHKISQDKLYGWFLLAIHTPFIAWSIYYIIHQSFIDALAPLVLAIIFYWQVNFRAFYKWIFRNYIAGRIRCHPDVRNYAESLTHYLAALKDWEYLNLETGEGFWRALRGEHFENALAKLFERRGLSVTKTKKTGDGGIDLIIRSSSKTIFIQCKGFAKPIPVAPIREIAGVCSIKNATPILAAVNGFTKGAKDCANELGVILIDTPRIVSLASKSKIQVEDF